MLDHLTHAIKDIYLANISLNVDIYFLLVLDLGENITILFIFKSA